MTNSELYKSILLRAKELLLTDGWCKHMMRNENGERCLLGAISDAKAKFFDPTGQFSLQEERAQNLVVWYDLVDLVQNETGCSVGYWNDTRGSVKEVVKLIDKIVEGLHV